jgi:hypothetical protein
MLAHETHPSKEPIAAKGFIHHNILVGIYAVLEMGLDRFNLDYKRESLN